MKKISKEQLEKWRAAGYNYRDIAKAAGISVSTVRKYMVKYGMIGANLVKEEEKQIFYKMRREGKSTPEIAKATGRSESAVYHALKEAGLIEENMAEKPKDEESDTFTPRVIRYAEKRKPKSERIVIHGKTWWDDSEFWIPY